jgi:exodeoxyribonuclease VII large subunit
VACLLAREGCIGLGDGDRVLHPPLVPEDRSLSFDFTAKVPKPADNEPRALTVAELDRAIKGAVEDAFSTPVWVEGEVSGARPAPNGHLYFCLKDEREEAAIDVVMYRSSVTPRMRVLCVDGARLRLRGKPTIWAPRGRLQLIADRLQATGRGALLEALERLKAKLAAEGLFTQERKRALPGEPRVVGVVTSPSGAVIHDVCRVAFRRGGARILLAPAQVQGPGAVDSICRALAQLQRVHDVDVIVLGRGGGSADDLGAFNEEAIVRAVAFCRVPIVSAVGHDVDVTLVDFAADARAATPSQAAEMVVPDRRAQGELLRRTRMHLARAMHNRVAHGRVAQGRVARRLGDPRLAIASHQQMLDDRLARLVARAQSAIARRRDTLLRAERRLSSLHPRAILARERAELTRLDHRLGTLWSGAFARRGAELHRAAARLDAYSPLKVLARGYAIATREDGRAIRTGDDVAPGQKIHLRVRDARLEAQVESVEAIEPDLSLDAARGKRS